MSITFDIYVPGGVSPLAQKKKGETALGYHQKRNFGATFVPRSYQLFRCQVLPLITVTRRIGNFSEQGIVGRSGSRQINLSMPIPIPARTFKIGLYVRVLEVVALAGKRLVPGDAEFGWSEVQSLELTSGVLLDAGVSQHVSIGVLDDLASQQLTSNRIGRKRGSAFGKGRNIFGTAA